MDDVYYIRSKNQQKDGNNIPYISFHENTQIKDAEKTGKLNKISKFVKPFKDFFVDFCNETSIHGFNHIVAPGRHILEKVGWAIATILAALGAVQLCRQQWQRYVENPTVLSLEKDFRTWNNTFPAITACLENRFSPYAAAKFIENTWNIKEGDSKFQYYMKFIEVVTNATMKDLDQFEEYKNDESLNDIDLYKIAVDVSTPFNVTSNWFDRTLNMNLVKVMTDLGICFTINSAVSQDHRVSSPEDGEESKFEPITCQYVTHPCYAKIEATNICVKYFVHSPYEIIDITMNMVTETCPSQDVSTDWKVMETKSSEDVKALTVVQRNCRYHTEAINDKQEVYSPGICRRACRNSLAIKLCGCKPFFYFQESGTQCGVSGMACLAKYKKQFLHECTCLPQCVDATYELAYIKEDIWKGPFASRCALKVLVLPPRSRYRRQILFYFEDLIVSFGGAAGLFLGCSFLSGIEIVYFILERTGYGILSIFGYRKNNTKNNIENDKKILKRVKFSDQLNAREIATKNYIQKIAEYDNFFAKENNKH